MVQVPVRGLVVELWDERGWLALSTQDMQQGPGQQPTLQTPPRCTRSQPCSTWPAAACLCLQKQAHNWCCRHP